MYRKRIVLLGAYLIGCSLTVTAQSSMRISLSELFQLVEKNSPSLQATRSDAGAADEALKAALSQRLPDVSASLSASYIGNALMTNRHLGDAHGLHSPHLGNSFSLQAAQTVYSGGATSAGIRKAEIACQMSQSQLCQTREEERFLALGQWLDLYRKDNAVSVVRKNIELTRQLIAQIKDRQQQGLALKNDITRYELQLQQLQLRLTQLENERLIANHSLNNTLGLNVQTRVECDSSVVFQTFGREAESVWQLAAAESPRMQQARLATDMARQDVRLAKAALLPKVSVFAIDDFNGPITYELPPINKNINVWAVGIGVSYPISGLFKNNHQLRQARKAEAAAQSRLDAAARHTDNAMQQARSLFVLCLLSFVGGFFKLCGTFECASNIQLWMTPKRDFRVFFPILYIFVVGDISLSGWLAQVLTYWCGSWQAMNWFIALLLLLVILGVFCLTKNFRFMKPCPLISVDWLGCVLWSLMLLEVIWLFNYGEYYNWAQSRVWRTVLLMLIVTTAVNIPRMFLIRHPYISPAAFRYKTLAPTLLLYCVAELMNATPKVLEGAFTSAVMHWGSYTLSVLHLVAIGGTVLGCVFTFLWCKVLNFHYTRLLILGFAALLGYQVLMYCYITPTLPLWRLYLPTVLRTFGYAIYFTALTIYLEELMPFEHFFMGLTISGFARNGMMEAISTGMFSYGIRYHVADNMARALPFGPEAALLTSIKQMFGLVCLFGVFFLLIYMLYDVPPVRTTMKKIPYWNQVGKQLIRSFARPRRFKRVD